jgi:hypothetical protein
MTPNLACGKAFQTRIVPAWNVPRNDLREIGLEPAAILAFHGNEDMERGYAFHAVPALRLERGTDPGSQRVSFFGLMLVNRAQKGLPGRLLTRVRFAK